MRNLLRYLLPLKPRILKSLINVSFFYLGMVAIAIVVAPSSVNGQDSWNLSRCLDYAVDHNLNLILAHNRVKLQEINLFESKTGILPDLNAGSGINRNFGRNIDGATNEITFNKTTLNDYWISSSVDLFKGFVQYNTIHFNRFLLAASQEELLLVKNKLIMEIINAYYTVVYNSGLFEVAINQVVVSEKQYLRMQKLMEVGRASTMMVQDLKSQWASDKLNRTTAENTLSKSVLAIKQLLRIEPNERFVLDTMSFKNMNIDTQDVDYLYKKAKLVLPQIKKQEYLYKASLKELAISKGAVLPRIYMSAGLSSRYFDGDTHQFSDQLRNNENKVLSLGLSIPIFNGASTYSKIKRKKIEVLNRELDLQIEQERLFTEIQTAVNELESAEKEYLASIELHDYSTLSLKNITKKMESGLASPSDFETVKQRLSSSKAALLKSKLIYIMRLQMLEFYKTGDWEHLY